MSGTGRGAGDVLARRLVAAAARSGATLATAESLTGGALAAAVVSVPGASTVFRGGVVAYASDLKESWLGVDPALLETRGTVDAAVAEAMADGVRARAGATLGVATTGVAGPEPVDDHPPGTAYVAVALGDGRRTRALALPGDRAAVRQATVRAALELAVEVVDDLAPERGGC